MPGNLWILGISPDILSREFALIYKCPSILHDSLRQWSDECVWELSCGEDGVVVDPVDPVSSDALMTPAGPPHRPRRPSDTWQTSRVQ